MINAIEVRKVVEMPNKGFIYIGNDISVWADKIEMTDDGFAIIYNDNGLVAFVHRTQPIEIDHEKIAYPEPVKITEV